MILIGYRHGLRASELCDPSKRTSREVAFVPISRPRAINSIIIFSRTRNFFAQTPSTERLPPFWGRNRFWTGFRERGHEQFSETQCPPTGGSHPRAHPSSLEMR